MEDKLLTLHTNLIQEGYDLPDYETFRNDMSDETKSKKLHENLVSEGYELPDYDTFLNDVGLKKKEVSEIGGVSANVSAQVSSTEQPQLEPTKEEERRPILDALRSLKSGSLKALGGITGAPSFLNRTFTGIAVRPIVKAMGGTDEEANMALDAIAMANPASQGVVRGAEMQQNLIKKANKVDEKIREIEGSIWDNIKKGEWGNAGELVMRGFMSSVPYFAMTAATAGGGSVATLSTIGATASAQQYGELEGVPEPKRRLNAWLYGGFEAAGELVTAGLLRGVGKAFREGTQKTINESFVKGASKQLAKDFGLEGSSEAVTQIGQNLTDILTGVDENKNVLSGVLDAFLIGGITGGGIGTAHAIAMLTGRTLASDKEVSDVQENIKQQEVLINQLEQTDVDPVKEALKRNIKFLKVQSDLIMDKNYELATKLTPEQQNQVAELYSVWNQLQDKIDSGQMTEVEAKAMQKTVEGIKGEIKAIKDDLIKRLDEEKKAEKQAKVDEVKEEQKTELDKLKEEETKKLDKVKDVAEGETVNKKKLDEIKETFDTKAEEIKAKTEEEVAKIEEEYTEKEPTMEEAIAEESKRDAIAETLGLRTTALDKAVNERNSLGDSNPQYFYPNVSEGRYQTWKEFRKNNKKIDEASLREHWKKITGEYPQEAPSELVNKIDKLHKEVLRIESESTPAKVEEVPTEVKEEVKTEEPTKVKEPNIFNKQQVIESLLSEYPEEVREQVRNSFARAENFEEMATQAGFNSLGGGQYTREPVAKVQEDVVQKEPVSTKLEQKGEVNTIVKDETAIPAKSKFNFESKEFVIGKDLIDEIKLLEASVKTMDRKEFGDLWLQTIDKLWEEAGRKTNEKTRTFEEYFQSLLPEGELLASSNIYEALKGTINDRWIVKTNDITIKAHNEDVVAKIDDKGRKILNDLVDFTAKKYPNKKLDVSIGLQPISVAGSDGFRMTPPNVDAPIDDMFPYDAKLVIPSLQKLEKEGVDRRTLWASFDWFHELAHTEGIHDEKEADAFAVDRINEFVRYKQAVPVEPLSTQEGIPAPPKVEEVAEVKEKGKEKYRKTQINALIQDETLQQQEIAKIVDANKEKYTVLHQADAVEQAKDFIDKQGVENATAELKEPTRKMADFPMRQVARQVLLDFYSRAIIDPNAKEADKKKAFRAIDDLQSITAREATKAGQGNALLQVWKSMQPSGLLEYVARKIATSNQKTLDKKIGDSTLGEQLDALYETLNEESKKIILDILAGKPTSMPKQEERPTKEPPKRKTVPKERIKKEQEYRKNLLDQYRKSEKPMAMAVTGLTSSQIELGGNLVASYVREGYYRMQDIVDRLIKDLKSVDIDADEKSINDIFKQPKTDKETLGEYIDKIESKAKTRSAEKNINKRISDVITEHWSVKDELKRTLAQKLVDEAGLTEEEANRLEKEILDKFDKEIISRSEKQLTKLLGTTKLPQEKKAKNIVGKMVELINMGALDEDLYRDLFAEKFNLVKLTDVHKEEILKLANNVQLASGKGWLERDATIRLAKYIFELYPESRSGEVFDTWIAMAYANMLAGPTTSILNMWSAGWNMSTKPIRDLSNLSKWLRLVKDATKGEGDIYNPFGEMFYSPMLRGSQAGLEQAQEVYRNGDLNNKYVEDVAKKNQFKVTQLERDKYGKSKRFKPVNVKIGNKTVDLNLFNAYKYSGRNLSAQDKFMLTTSYEVELAHILRDKLKNRDLKGKALTHEVMSILRGDHIDMEELNSNLESEALLYHQMTGEWMTDLQKKIRKREMMLDQLPLTPEEKEEAERLARSNIFTDDRFGVIATMANAIGAAANKSYTVGLIIKPFIPFTKVVGNVAEYMLDHVPFYGFMRANGLSISYIKKLIDSEAQTAQMGERGSRAYYEQMGRAWLGTMSFIVMGMLFLGRDDEDFMEVSGGYLQEGFKKKGRENVLPPYTLRIGNVKIPYKNIPALAIPLALIGNVNDALKSKQDEGEVMDRFTVALFLEACQNTVFMFKDMSFLDGAQRLAQIASDIASTDEKKWKDISENAIKSYLGFATRPLPQNNNAVQQIWKFFDPESYPQNDIKGTLMYAAGVQHFSKYTAIDQLGDAVTSYPGETLMPYTHWLKIKGEDERWKFLAKYNAIPNKIYNRVMQIDTPTGVEKRKLEEDELYEYSKRSGDLFSKKVIKYMSDKEKIAKRGSEIIEREKSNGEIEKINGIREDVEKLWSDAKKQSETELFKWSIFKEKFPKKWEILKDNQALQMPQSSMRDIFMGEEAEKLKFNEEDIAKFNTKAMELYSDMVIPTIQAMDSESRKRKLPTGETEYDYIINSLWTAAKQQAKAEIVEEKMATKK